MKYLQSLILTIALLFSIQLYAQPSQNISLFAEKDRGDSRYSGSWSYVAPNGSEYALVGARSGLAVYTIDNINAVNEVGFIPGPGSNWREITVVGSHAYVVTEGSGSGSGMQVIDLSNLPNGVSLVTTYTATMTRGHMIQSDIYNPNSPYVYVAGASGQSGIQVIDVSNPANPVRVGYYGPYYIHDLHVRGNRIYASAIYESAIDVIDITNKTNPTLITQISYSGGFTHSASTSADNNYLLVADEVDGLPMRTWNIADENNIFQVSTWTANPQSLVHNPYVRGDFAFISHNTEGLRVLDIVKPDLPIEVGFYDTFSGSSGGFSGLWSACPYFPSGKIIGGDRTRGLMVWEFNNTYAGRVYGEVKDASTGLPIFQATIDVIGPSNTYSTDLNGAFKFGDVPMTFDLQVSKPGFLPETIPGIVLNGGDSLWFEILLAPDKFVSAEIKVNLAGPYNTTTGAMNDDLRLQSYLPTSEPHTALGFTHVNSIGGEVIDPAIFNTSGTTAIVDWVFLEAIDKNNTNNVLATRSGLLRRDGQVINVDGGTDIQFYNLMPDQYYVAVRHRNHLRVRTAATNYLDIINFPMIDFSSGNTAPATAQQNFNGVWAMWGGDTDATNTVNAADRSNVWNDRNAVGYLNTDSNLTGTCDAADRSIIWNNRNLSGM